MSDRSITAIDTSAIVPGLLFWHEKHEAASAALVQARAPGPAAAAARQNL